MRASALFAALALAALWSCSAWLWPALPARIPMHFDFGGRPDRWVERTPFQWFLLPAIGTGMGLLFALALPAWIRRLAAKDSAYLNVPEKRAFARLAPEARVRAVLPMMVLLRVIAAEVALLFAGILIGSARVAAGASSGLPPALLWTAVLALPATALCSIPFGHASVRRELERARSASAPRDR